MMQKLLFDFRTDRLFESENQVAKYYDVLSETESEIRYSEHIDPKKGYSICGMEYEEYVDIKKKDLKNLSYDQILNFLRNTKKEQRLEKYKKLLLFNEIKYDADTFTWYNDDL